MKRTLTYLTILFLFISTANSFAGMSFETERIKSTYYLLPVGIQEAITNNTQHHNLLLNSNSIHPNSQIDVHYNTDHQISLIGFHLSNDSIVEKCDLDAYYFIENCLLNCKLQSKTSKISEFVKDKGISIFSNSKEIKLEPETINSYLMRLLKMKFTLKFENSYFTAYWWSQTSIDNFSIKFPANINLIKGMDKSELEQDFIRELKNKSTNLVTKQIDIDRVKKYNSDLYIQAESRFQTDDFRSDVYLIKKGEKYEPVFSAKYPVESFSNLFVCSLPHPIHAEVTQFLYGDAKRTNSFILEELQSNLANNAKVYFGLKNNDKATIEATIIYFNPIYKYIHMLLVEANKEQVFSTNENVIKARLYTFIPYNEQNSKYDLTK